MENNNKLQSQYKEKRIQLIKNKIINSDKEKNIVEIINTMNSFFEPHDSIVHNKLLKYAKQLVGRVSIVLTSEEKELIAKINTKEDQEDSD